MIERLRVRIPAGAAGECYSPEFTLCTDAVARKRPGHSAKSAGGRLHLNHVLTLDPTKSEWADCAAI